MIYITGVKAPLTLKHLDVLNDNFCMLKEHKSNSLQVAIKKKALTRYPLTFFLFLSSFLVMESLGALCVKLLPWILNASICRDLKAN